MRLHLYKREDRTSEEIWNTELGGNRQREETAWVRGRENMYVQYIIDRWRR